MALCLFAPLAAASDSPELLGNFAAAPFDVADRPDAAIVAWRFGDAVMSGLLYLKDGRFVPFPDIATPTGERASSVTVSPAGTRTNRRAVLAWVHQRGVLVLTVLDADGSVVRASQDVGPAIQIVKPVIAPIDTGALVAYAWDSNPYWDPRVIELDFDSNDFEYQRLQDAVGPEQTLGVTLPATSAGARAPVWIVSDTHLVRTRREAPDGTHEEPVTIFNDASADYRPRSAVFSPQPGSPFAWVTIPWLGVYSDVLFARVPFDFRSVSVGPTLTALAPAFSSPFSRFRGFAALAGTPEYAVALWEEFERAEFCACSIPPVIRVEYFAQLLRVSETLEPVGEPFAAYSWREGDEMVRPYLGPELVASARERGRFSVLWSNGRLQHVTVEAFGPAVVTVATTSAGTVLRWQDVPAGVSYDVVRGELEELLQGDLIHLGPLTCIEAGSVDTTTEGNEDAEIPLSGKAFFYLVETVLDDGSRSLGRGAEGTPRVLPPGTCPVSP